MGKCYDEIDETLRAFIEAQKMFFVATAPAAFGGHINLSPKGLESLRILGPRTVAYLDFTGSGIETVAHLRDNGRIVIMLCAFEGPPRILRLHGRGAVIEPQDQSFAALLSHFTPAPGVRAVIRIELDRISDSCGYGVPLMRYEADRSQLSAWAERKGAAGLAEYRRKNNAASIDDLPGMRLANKPSSAGTGRIFSGEFDKLEWESPASGCRFKAFRRDGKQLRLVEFTPAFVEEGWCKKGHMGIVLSGAMEIDFGGMLVHYPEGTAIFIPEGNAHRARHLTPLVRLFLVEEP